MKQDQLESDLSTARGCWVSIRSDQQLGGNETNIIIKSLYTLLKLATNNQNAVNI